MGRPANCDCRCGLHPSCSAGLAPQHDEIGSDDKLVTQFAITENLSWQFVEVLDPPETLTLTFWRSYYYYNDQPAESFSFYTPSGFSAAALTWNADELRYEGTLNASPNDDLSNTVAAYINICEFAPGGGAGTGGRYWILSGQLVGTEGATLAVGQVPQIFDPSGSASSIGDADLGALQVIANYLRSTDGDPDDYKANFHRFLYQYPEVLLVTDFDEFGDCVCGRMNQNPLVGNDGYCAADAGGYCLGLEFSTGIYLSQWRNHAMRDTSDNVDSGANSDQSLFGRPLGDVRSGSDLAQFSLLFQVSEYCGRGFYYSIFWGAGFSPWDSNTVPYARRVNGGCATNTAFDDCDAPASLTVAFAAWERTEDYPVGF